jgi:hypothetical protein
VNTKRTITEAFDRWKGALIDQDKQTIQAARHRAHARVMTTAIHGIGRLSNQSPIDLALPPGPARRYHCLRSKTLRQSSFSAANPVAT